MINFVCVCLCLVSINNAHPLEGFRQDLIADLKDYFGQEVNRIELKYADETNALRQELTTCKEEINKLKLKLSQERHERVIKIARLKQRQSVVIKELHDLKLQLHGEYIEEGKRNDHLRNELYLRKHKDEGLLKLKTNLKVAENNTIPHGAEKIQHTSKNCTYENRSGKQVMSADPGADSNSRSKVRRFVDNKRQVHHSPNGPGVAFFASLNSYSIQNNQSQTIIFDKVITNMGYAYNVAQGEFIAPKPGVYVFSAIILSSNQNAHAKLVINGQLLVRLTTHYWEQTGQTVVVQLKSGDIVAVKNDDISGITFNGDLYSSFAGFLLYDFTGMPSVVG